MADGNGTDVAVVEGNGRLRELAAAIPVGAGGLQPKNMAEVIDFAQLMAKAGPMVGKAFRGNPGACLGITMQAVRWGMDPFAVSQKAYVTGDNIAYEAQLVTAVINAHAPVVARPKFAFAGDGAKRRCTVSATMRGEAEASIYVSPEIGQITIKNSPLWKTDPDQQLGYYSIRAWARRFCPDIIMGVYTPDEMESVVTVEGQSSPVGAPQIENVKSAYRAKKDGDWEWFMSELAQCASEDDVDALLTSERCLQMPRAWRDHDMPEAVEKHMEQNAAGGASPTKPASPAASAEGAPVPAPSARLQQNAGAPESEPAGEPPGLRADGPCGSPTSRKARA